MAASTIGIAGVGNMGLGIATNLLKAGFRLRFLEHAGNQPVGSLVEAGAIPCQSPDILVADADVVLLCLTGAPEVEGVMSGANGILSALKPGTTIIDCSTSLPETTQKLSVLTGKAGGKYIDAPMTRTPKEAMEGRLNLLVGGSEDEIDAVRPVLDAIAENVVHAGNTGQGHAMKLLHNFVSLGFSAILAEAAAAAQQNGVDPTVFVEILEKGGGKGVVLDRFKPQLLEGLADGMRFSIANADKDMGYYLELAQQLNVSTRAAAAVRETYRSQVDAGQGDRFVPELVTLLKGS